MRWTRDTPASSPAGAVVCLLGGPGQHRGTAGTTQVGTINLANEAIVVVVVRGMPIPVDQVPNLIDRLVVASDSAVDDASSACVPARRDL